MNLDIASLVLRLLVAAALGALVGVERESASRGAGVRTHALVALGSCLFTVAGAYGFADVDRGPNGDPARVAAHVAAGVGFIGAGAIIRHGVAVVGVTTAASVWLAASIGVAAAAGGYAAAAVATVLALALLVSLRATKPIAQRLGRQRAIVELEYTRGHGTLGPLLRSLEEVEGRVHQLSVEDDDAEANGDGTRTVVLEVTVRRLEDLDRLVEQAEARPEVKTVRVGGGEGS